MAVIISNPSSVFKVTLTNGGSGYTVADELTIGAGTASIVVDTIDGSGTILTFSYKARGTGYSTGSASLVGGTGSSATVTVDSLCSTLDTANSFYRVEAHNLNGFGSVFPLSTRRLFPVTFANAGNCQGVMLTLKGDSAQYTITHSVQVDLQEAVTCTFTSGTPGVVNYVGHGRVEGEIVNFSTTGTLPGGISATTTYYARNPAANTFNISTTPTGALTNLTGTGTGTHTLWLNRATVTYTIDDILHNTNGYDVGYSAFSIPFTGGTFPYAVDTTAGKWQFAAFKIGASNGNLQLCSGNTSVNNATFATWCDTAATFADNDVPIFKDITLIDKTATLGSMTYSSYTPTTNTALAGLVCRSLYPSEDTVNLQWVEDPQASYKLTLPATLLISARGGIAIGKSYKPHPLNKQAWFYLTSDGSFLYPAGTTAYNLAGKLFIFMNGELDSKLQATTLNGALSVGATTLTTTDATGWAIGDEFSIGRLTAQNTSSNVANRIGYSITNISGTSITFSPAIQSGMARYNGASVCYLGQRAIKFESAALRSLILTGLSQFHITGADFINVYNFGQGVGQQAYNGYYGLAETPTYDTGYFIYDSTFRCNTAGGPNLLAGVIPRGGITVKRCVFNSFRFCASMTAIYNNWMSSGRFVFEDNFQLHFYSNNSQYAPSLTANARFDINRNRFESADEPFINLQGIDGTLKDNSFWGGYGYAAGAAAALQLGQLIASGDMSGNTFDNNRRGIYILESPIVNTTMKSNSFGTIVANSVADIIVSANGFFQLLFEDTIATTITTTDLSSCANGTELRFSNLNSTNNDRVYTPYGIMQRTGDGLTDTTVRTSGTGKFALRFEPLSSTNNLYWSFGVPTGNIQNKTMTVGVWCKINSATYYAGTHQLPRLTIDYDNGTTAYHQAGETTDWQLLFVSFTPTTTYGQITVTLSGRTDATITDAYIYFDDFTVAYPPSVALDLGGMDNWANALPVTPPIALPISAGTVAQNVWQQLTTTSWGTNSMGEAVKDIPGKIKVIDRGEIPIY